VSRPAHGRARVLQAAHALLIEGGVRNLTLSQLERRSGVTRGGILYHWPNREALVAGLIAHDQQAWELQCRRACADDPGLTGHIRLALQPIDGIGALAAQLIPEARELPTAWAALEHREMDRFAGWRWDSADVERYLLLLAAEGAFWRRLHGLTPAVSDLDSRLREAIERRLAEVGKASVSPHDFHPKDEVLA
jgi:AcrR family transcriptional regulator